MARKRAEDLVNALQAAKSAGRSHRMIAEASEISPQSLSNYKDGRLPDVLVGQRIARSLGTRVELLWPLKEAKAHEAPS